MKKSSFPKGSSQYINKLNKIKILNLIRESGTISRADAAKLSGISAPTVTRIVETLIHEEGLVRDIGEGVSSGGRRPKLLEFAGLDNFVIGIDLGTTHIHGVVSNLNAEVIAEEKSNTRVQDGFQRIIEKTSEVIHRLQNHSSVQNKKIFGIGMAVAGLINREKNIVEYSPDFHWKDADILAEMRSDIDIPIIFDNVTRVMALGELWYGVGKTLKNFIVVNVGYGIGAGIIVNGKPLYGPRGMAGEFGHLTLEKNSTVRCECGNYGCLEALASGRAIALAAQKELENGNSSLLSKMANNDLSNITAEMVAGAAREGDSLAGSIFNSAAEFIGIGIAGLINLISTEAIILGGGVSQSWDLLYNPVKNTITKRAIDTISRNVQVQPATFGIKAAVMGSVALILNEVLHLNHKSGIPEPQEV